MPHSIFQAIIFSMLLGCSSTGVIKTSEKASIYKLDANYKIESMYATDNVEVDTDSRSNRFLFRRPGAGDEILLVIFPAVMNDELTVKLERMETTLLRSDINRQYLDLSAEVYRHILRGEIALANERLQVLQTKYGRTFSYYFYSGLIAVAMQDTEAAVKAFAIAKDLNPDAAELDKFITDFTAQIQSGGARNL